MPIRGDRLRWPPRPGKRSGYAAISGAQRSSSDAAQSADAKQPFPQPNERDESVDQGPPQFRQSTHQAHDVASGQQENSLPRSDG